MVVTCIDVFILLEFYMWLILNI